MNTPASMTSVQEDYLRAIFYLSGAEEKEVQPIQIAQYLHLKKHTVTERLQALSTQGYVRYQRYASVSLTKKGKTIAKKLTNKHRLIEVFLHRILNRPVHTIHEEAHRLEHAFSDASIQALKTLLDNPSVDPHGSPIKI